MNTPPSTSSHRFATAGRVAAGLAVTAASLAMFGGSAFAADDDPVVPLLTPIDDLGLDFGPVEPIVPIVPELTLPDFPLIPEDTVPEVDFPTISIPDDILIPGGDLPDLPDLPEIPVCVVWNPADVAVTSVDNGDLTATVTVAYSGPGEVCDDNIWVHSIQEDEAMTPLILLDTELVTFAQLVADADHTIEVDLPLDPCYTEVSAYGPGDVLLHEEHYGEGCPVETTEPPVETTEPPVETTDPPVDTTDPTVPPTNPQPTVPGGTLPQTGSPSTVIALLGAALVLTGGCLAIGVRRSQGAA